MRDRHTLRVAGRAGRVQDVGDVVEVDRAELGAVAVRESVGQLVEDQDEFGVGGDHLVASRRDRRDRASRTRHRRGARRASRSARPRSDASATRPSHRARHPVTSASAATSSARRSNAAAVISSPSSATTRWGSVGQQRTDLLVDRCGHRRLHLGGVEQLELLRLALDRSVRCRARPHPVGRGCGGRRRRHDRAGVARPDRRTARC